MHWFDVHFLRPWWLLLLLLAVWSYIRPLARGPVTSPWAKIIEPHLLPHLLSGFAESRRRWWHKILFPLFIACIALALAGPTGQKMPTAMGLGKTPLIIALEVSDQMLKGDIAPNRLRRATYKMSDLFHAYPGAEIALIAFAGDAHVVVPFTEDYHTIKTLSQTLSPELMPKMGRTIASVIELANDMAQRKPNARLLLIASDLGKQDEAAVAIQESMLSVMWWVFADTPSFVFDKAGFTQVSFAPDDADIRAIVSALTTSSSVVSPKDYFYDTWVDLGPYFLCLAMLIFVVAFWVARDQLLFLLLLVVIQPTPVKAGGFFDLFLRKDQQGQQALDQGDYTKAAALFEDDVRKGLAYYRAKMYDKAIEHLSRVNTADGRYNLGNALAQKGQYAEAIQAYNEALKLNSNNLDAKANKELLEAFLQKDQQKQSQQPKEPEPKSPEEQKQQEQGESQSKKPSENQGSSAPNQQKSNDNNGEKKPGSGEPEKKTASPQKGEDKAASQENNDSKQGKPIPPAAKPTDGGLDQETRYHFQKLEQHNSLYLKRKFRYESEKRQEQK